MPGFIPVDKDVWTSFNLRMSSHASKNPPGRVRDAILKVLQAAQSPLSLNEIESGVKTQLGTTPRSSIRSYILLNTPEVFFREERGVYGLKTGDRAAVSINETKADGIEYKKIGRATLYCDNCLNWIKQQPRNSLHAVVTDPPYGLHEYTPEQQTKLRNGKGGVWRIPPSFDGHKRSPLPRFTTLTEDQLHLLRNFFQSWAELLLPKLVPGAHVIVASNPLVSYIVSWALAKAGLERRGEIIRLTMTMRGGDRPKAAHDEYPEISVMPRSMWEPWLVYRRPLDGRVQDNLKEWKTGGFRRIGRDKPFGDVICSAPTHKSERMLAPHPSLKPQAFLRQIVRAVLPLGEGVVLDPFAGAGSTLAAAENVGYASIGIEQDKHFYAIACDAIPRLSKLKTKQPIADTPSFL